MKIGVGCTTYNRYEHLKFWSKKILETSNPDVIIHIANDNKERKGIAFRKTECIRELYNEGCDYIFLFDDDCFPIKKGWEQYFIDASIKSKQAHFIYQHETPSVKLMDSFNGINSFDHSNGCMLFITREVAEKVGGFSPNFGLYGFEHSNYSNRIHNMGFTTIGKYLCPNKASNYIYSLDIDNSHPEWHKQLKHSGSMKAKEAIHHAQNNLNVYQTDTVNYYPL